MRRLLAVALLPPLVGLALLAPPSAAADTLLHRDLQCDQYSKPRAAVICRITEQEMEWTWLGHAIIAPGYRITLEGQLRTYCKAEITPEDTAILVELALDPRYQQNPAQVLVQDSARDLLKLLGQAALDQFPTPADLPESVRTAAPYLKQEIAIAIGNESSSVYSPSHPAYILREGCPTEPEK